MPRSIEDFKAAISASSGLAMQNRYRVDFAFPKGITSTAADSEVMELLCDSATIPARSLLTIDYQAHKQSYKIAQGFTQEDATFTFLLTEDYSAKRVFEAWMKKAVDFDTYRASYRNDYVADITVWQTSKNDSLLSYFGTLQFAYPINVSGITFDNSSENTIQKLTVTFAYESLKLMSYEADKANLETARRKIDEAKVLTDLGYIELNYRPPTE